jgi:2-polyprenyl-6-hydroxyphenyl methylase/3-demethylubiquinone-9 3-methyltransferase
VTQPPHKLAGYPWNDAQHTYAHEYLLPELEDVLERAAPDPEHTRVLDVGCGNGAVTAWLARRGFQVVGVDPSSEGIERARAAHPDLEFRRASAYDRLADELGAFSLVVSLEVVEHVYDPPRFARTVFEALRPNGTLVLSTPYHGWLKNVAIALLGRFDDHVDALRVHGHIKFWSRRTLTRLLEEAGFELQEFRFAGRIRPLAKSMIAVARRPAEKSTSAHPETGTSPT